MPQVTLLDPANGSIDRPLNQAMVLEFSDPLDPATLAFDPLNLNLSSFGVYANALETAGDISGGIAIAGQAALSNFNRTLTFTPSPNLPEGASIHTRLTNGLHDTCGNPLQTAANGVKLFDFSTQPPDSSPPPAPTVNPVPALTNLGSITVSGSAEALSSDNPSISGSIVSATDSSVIADTNIGTIAATGATSLGLTTLGGTVTLPFTVNQKPPPITAINPMQGIRGTTVNATLSGSGLSAISSISIDGTGVTLNDLAIGNDSSHNIELVISAGATLGARTITVTTPGGTDTVFFTVLEFHTPAFIEWTAAGGGDWNNPANWSENRVPGPGDDVRIAATGPVTINGGTAFAKSLNLFSDLTASNTIFEINSPLVPAVFIDVVANLKLDSDTTFRVINGMTLNGMLTLSDSHDGGQPVDSGRKVQIDFQGIQTLDGTGEVVFDNSGSGDTDANIMWATGNGILTVAAGMTVRGRGGVLGDPFGGLVSNGILRADVSSGTLQINVATFDNQGTMGAINNGRLTVNNLITPHSGAIVISTGGIVTINGDLTQTLSGAVTVGIYGSAGRVDVTGTASLAGALDVQLLNGFIPTLGNRFQFMTYGSRTGLFDTTLGLLIGGGDLAFDLDTTDLTDLELVVVPN